MGGFLSGLSGGAVASVLALGALSLATPLPVPEDAAQIEAEPGSAMQEVAAPERAPAASQETSDEPQSSASELGAEDADRSDLPQDPPIEEPAPRPVESGATDGQTDPAPEEGQGIDQLTGGTPEADPAATLPESLLNPQSQAAAVEQAPATSVLVPTGSAFNRPPEDLDAPQPTRSSNAEPSVPTVPELTEAESQGPDLDTSSAPQPVVAESLSPVAEVEATALEMPNLASSDAQLALNAAPDPLGTQSASQSPEVELSSPPPPAPDVPSEPLAVAIVPPSLPDFSAPATPSVEEAREVTTSSETAPREPSAPAEPAAVTSGGQNNQTTGAPAIIAHAEPFDPTETRPLVSVVLLDDPDSLIAIETLTRFTFPVTFAVDPSRRDAAERAAIYRSSGFEVAMLTRGLVEGASPGEVEARLAEAVEILPEAVALVDTPSGALARQTRLLDPLVEELGSSGHGLVTFEAGSDRVSAAASAAEVPSATFYRLLDDDDQRATQITRFLSRAAYEAASESAVVVAGQLRPDTITALYSWALRDSTGAVAIAPLSAALLRLAEQ